MADEDVDVDMGVSERLRATTSRSRIAHVAMAALITFSALTGVVHKHPCIQVQWDFGQVGKPISAIHDNTCYSDLPLLYRSALANGKIPFFDARRELPDGSLEYVEYPVLTGIVMYAVASLTRAFGDQDDAAESVRFFYANAVLFWLLALVTGWSMLQVSPRGRPWDVLLFAVAPPLAYTSTSNWDLLPVALTGLALVAWQRERLLLAGGLVGLGCAAKLYPILVLVAVLVLGWRTGRRVEALRTSTAAVAVAALVNLPFALLAPGWSYFFTMNSARGADFGTIWLILVRHGIVFQQLNAITLGAFCLGCLGIAVLGLRASTPPRLVQMIALILIVFLLTNKVYSIQYALWLIPIVVLAHPRPRHVLPWLAIELFLWQATWNSMATDPGAAAGVWYEWATVAHLVGLIWIAALVVRDVRRPDDDVVRRGFAEDLITRNPDGVFAVPTGADSSSGTAGHQP